MNSFYNILIFFLLSFFTACTVSTAKLPEPAKLKSAIANSIEIPFQSGDTVIYHSFIGICGNSSKEELNRFYEPQLNTQPCFGILKQKIKRTTLCTGDSLYALMNRQCGNNTYSPTTWDRFSKNKIVLSITGEAVTNSSVNIVENYSYNNEHKWIEKLFTYSGGKWKFKIVDNK